MASTRTKTPSLATTYEYMRKEAERTEKDKTTELRGGARLAVRVRAGEVTLTVSRKKQPVGSREINTFLGHCKVPATAIRWPEQGQNTRIDDAGFKWHYIAWRWLAEDEGGEEIRIEEPPAPEPKPDPNRTVFVCQLCEEHTIESELTTDADFRQHAFEKHGITASDIKTAKRTSYAHLNMRPHFQEHSGYALEDGRLLVLVVRYSGPKG